MKKIGLFAMWTLFCFVVGFLTGKIAEIGRELQKDVELYQKKEIATCEQEKTAEKIKIVYKELKTNEKDCDFVLDFDVSKCLPN